MSEMFVGLRAPKLISEKLGLRDAFDISEFERAYNQITQEYEAAHRIKQEYFDAEKRLQQQFADEIRSYLIEVEFTEDDVFAKEGDHLGYLYIRYKDDIVPVGKIGIYRVTSFDDEDNIMSEIGTVPDYETVVNWLEKVKREGTLQDFLFDENRNFTAKVYDCTREEALRIIEKWKKYFKIYMTNYVDKHPFRQIDAVHLRPDAFEDLFAKSESEREKIKAKDKQMTRMFVSKYLPWLQLFFDMKKSSLLSTKEEYWEAYPKHPAVRVSEKINVFYMEDLKKLLDEVKRAIDKIEEQTIVRVKVKGKTVFLLTAADFKKTPQGEFVLEVPQDIAGHVIGKGGENIKKISQFFFGRRIKVVPVEPLNISGPIQVSVLGRDFDS